MDMDGKVAIVTGGGGGIGRATAELLARLGAHVVVAGRRRAPLDATVRAIEGRGGSAAAFPADLTSGDDAAALVRHALGRSGRLDGAVNAAGGAYVSSLVDSDETEFDGVLAGNLKATWLALKYEIPAMAGGGGGSIVNISSRAGLVGIANGSAYSAAKHAVVGLTKSAALEVGHLGIRVNAVCPGATRTTQFDRIVAQAMPGASSEDAAILLGSKLPLGRIAEPDEVAAVIAWLLGPGASFMTGAIVPVDGGGGAG